MLKVGDRFASWKNTLGRIEEYAKATHQVFVVAPGQAKTTKQNPLHDLFPYSSARPTFKQGGKYKPHREKEEPKDPNEAFFNGASLRNWVSSSVVSTNTVQPSSSVAQDEQPHT